MNRPHAFYLLKNTGLYALVPPLIVAVLLPLGFTAIRSSGNVGASQVYLSYSFRLLVPLVAAWWPLFVFKERLEGDGRELLYFLRPAGGAASTLVLLAAYSVLVAPLVAVALMSAGSSLGDVLVSYARCLLMVSMVFWASFVFRSSLVALVFALIFNLGAMAPLEQLLDSSGSILMSEDGGAAPTATILFYVVVSAAMLAHGELRSRRFTP
ncbi:MAG: hypothetical protein P1P71_09535 [Anaerosomatales bacterium]|nr:hypothetical protein [Anaerosomatales bacterium]